MLELRDWKLELVAIKEALECGYETNIKDFILKTESFRLKPMILR